MFAMCQRDTWRLRLQRFPESSQKSMRGAYRKPAERVHPIITISTRRWRPSNTPFTACSARRG